MTSSESVRPLRTREDLWDEVTDLADYWFIEQMRHPSDTFYLVYRESTSEVPGALGISVDADNVWQIAMSMSSAWTREQGRTRIWEAAQKLPVMDIREEQETAA